MTKKRLYLILAREKLGLTKKEVAEKTGIERQRYVRIEANSGVKVDVEEAYRIAKLLGYEHPKDIFLPKIV